MASGDDKSQLPRGLIGRTGTPSAKGARLPSIKGPRDLTLGGVQKKVFTPNIPARRVKTEASEASASGDSSSDKSGQGGGKGRHSGPRGRDSGPRGRGRGRGRGRQSANVIQTHSLFEQGPTEKIQKPSGGSELSYSGGGRGGGGSSSSTKKTFKTERTDEETKEVLDHLLRDDFISGPSTEEDITLMPVKLPMVVKADLDPKQEVDSKAKVKVKEEPMEVDSGSHGDSKVKDTVGKNVTKATTEREPVTCSELFTSQNKYDEGQLLYIQLPDSLPGLPLSTDEDFKKKDSTEKEKDKAKKSKSCGLDHFSEGLIGKLVVRKSGRVQLMLGNSYLDVNMGTPNGFLQDLASVRVDENGGDLSVLGHIEHRLVCTPDFETLLDSS